MLTWRKARKLKQFWRYMKQNYTINQSINVYWSKQPTGFSNRSRLAEPLFKGNIILLVLMHKNRWYYLQKKCPAHMGTPACTTSTTRTNRDQPRAGRERDGPKTTNKQQSLHPTTTMAIPPIKLTPSQLHLLGTFTVLLVTFREITRQPLLAMSSSTCSHYLDNHYTLIMHIDSSSWR